MVIKSILKLFSQAFLFIFYTQKELKSWKLDTLCSSPKRSVFYFYLLRFSIIRQNYRDKMIFLSFDRNFGFKIYKIPTFNRNLFEKIVNKKMQKDEEWSFGPTKDYPYAFQYTPKLQFIGNEQFINPFLGYPNCPLIGRYNQGEYRIADTKFHFEFLCKYDHKQGVYKCGPNTINLPDKMVYNLQNIPEIIKHNKPLTSKNTKIQQVHPIKFPILNEVKFIFILTFGQIGKDFLNYLNHMYTLAHDLFIDQKLRRSVYMLPIYAYLPQKSGLVQEEVDKGLCLQNYRSEFLSLHLKYGAPAFSPNNMRLGIEGMKKVVSNPPSKKAAKNHIQKDQKAQKLIDEFLHKAPREQKVEDQQDLFGQNKFYQEKNSQKPQPKVPHKGFVHFYTSVLLQNDYRVYYHWHVENKQRRQIVEAALSNSCSVIGFLLKCRDLLGHQDECVRQSLRLFDKKQ